MKKITGTMKQLGAKKDLNVAPASTMTSSVTSYYRGCHQDAKLTSMKTGNNQQRKGTINK
jgi:hypothetical protein